METSDSNDLSVLEARVDRLLAVVRQLRTENTSLRAQQDELVAERAALFDKTEQARLRIETMINRLRAMEGSS